LRRGALGYRVTECISKYGGERGSAATDVPLLDYDPLAADFQQGAYRLGSGLDCGRKNAR